MMAHPDLITTGPRDYRGFREVCAPTWRPRYSHAEIFTAIGTVQQTWAQWGRPQTQTGNLARMPRATSSYMALLDGAHPVYRVVRLLEFPRLAGKDAAFPPHITGSQDEAGDLMRRHDILPGDVRGAFELDPANRAQSIRLIGQNPVRWAMLLLMVDEHPYIAVEPRWAELDEETAVDGIDYSPAAMLAY